MTYYELAERAAQVANETLGTNNIDPHWIYAQWRLESSDFTSDLAKENNNYGGVTQEEPNGEENRLKGTNLYFKIFDSPEEYAEYMGHYLAKYAPYGIGDAHDVDSYLDALYAGNYFTEKDNEDNKYYDGIKAKLGEEYSPITAVGSIPVDRQGHSRYGHEYIPDAPAPMEERDPISRFVDAADDAILDSGVTSSLRYLWSWINPAVRGSVSIPGFSTPYTPSDEEIDYVKKLMPNDPTAQNFVLTNSYSQDHLFMLAAMKKQDYDRAVRLAQDEHMQGYNIAGIAGSLAGGMLEPVNLALMATGLSEGALIAKGIKSVAGGIGAKYLGGVTADTMVGQLARMFGTNADKLSMFAKSKVARMAANAATGASMMGLDRALSNKYGGFEANYAQYMVQAAILGNAFDAMRTVKGVLPKSKTLQKVYGHLNRSEDNMLTGAFGMKPTDTLKKRVNTELKQISESTELEDVKLSGKEAKENKVKKDNLKLTGKVTEETVPSSGIKAKAAKPIDTMRRRLKLKVKEMKEMGLNDVGKGCFILSSNQATAFATKHGIKITNRQTAFTVPGTGQYVIIGDRVASKRALADVVRDMHTQTTGLRDVIGSAYKEILRDKKVNVNSRTSIYDLLEDKNWDLHNYTVRKVLSLARANIYALRGIKTKKPKDATLLKWVKASAYEQKYRDTPIKVSPDGTAYIYDTAFDKDSPVNFHAEMVWDNEQKEVDDWMHRSLPHWFPTRLGKHLEAGGLFKTIYGVLGHSRLLAVRSLNDFLFEPTRGRIAARANPVVGERIKQYLQQRVKPMLNDYYDARNAWLQKNKFYKFQGQYRLEFDRQVQQCFNAQYAGNKAGLSPNEMVWEPEVIKAAETIKKIREGCLTMMQEDSQFHGGGGYGSYIDKDWKPLDLEFTRKVDNEMLTRLVDFMDGDTETCMKKMYEYAQMACKRDVVRKQMEADAKRRYLKAHKEWEDKMFSGRVPKPEFNETNKRSKQGKALKDAGYQKTVGKQLELDTSTIPEEPQLEKVTKAMVEEEIDKRCKAWARGVIDQNASETCFSGGKYGVSIPQFLKSRLPMDTTVRMPIANKAGTTLDFSFDSHLRDVNTDRIINSYIDRVCGEVAVFDSIGNWRQTGVLDDVAKQLELGIKAGKITKSAAKEQKDALTEGMSRLLSTHVDTKPKTLWDAFSELFRTKSYADVGGQMFMAQLGEFGSAMAYAGTRVLYKSIPILRQMRRAMLSASDKELEDFAKDAQARLYGRELNTRFWDRNADYEARSFRDALGYSSVWGKRLDNAQETMKIFSNVTSTLNQLPKLTDWMIRQTRESGFIDAIKWARGEKISSTRDPFSKYLLDAAHVQDVDKLKAHIKKYLDSGKFDPDVFDKWRKEDHQTFFEFRNLIDNYSKRGIQQMSIGNTPLLKEKNWFTKLLFQFKDYSLRAVNDQTLRALSSRQMDDALAALASMGTNCMSYMGLVYLRALVKYPNDPEGRKEYIAKQLTPGRLAWAAFSRGAITGSIPSFGSDIYEILTGTPMMRTTVDNSSKTSGTGKDMKAGSIVGRAVDQMPAVSSNINPIMGFGDSIYNSTVGDGMSQEDMANILKVVPFNGFWGMTLLASEIRDASGVKKRKEMNKEKKQRERKNRYKIGADSGNNRNANSDISSIMNVK